MQALLEILWVLLRGLMNTEIQRHQEDEFKMLQYSLVVFCAKKKKQIAAKEHFIQSLSVSVYQKPASDLWKAALTWCEPQWQEAASRVHTAGAGAVSTMDLTQYIMSISEQDSVIIFEDVS